MQHKRGSARHHVLWLGLGASTRIFLTYAAIVLLVSLSDAILSYAVPVHIERYVNSTLLMGLILGFSSLVGIVCDVLFAEWFGGKSFRFFLLWVFVLAFLFPLTVLFLPPLPLFFLLAMATWGVYYELLHFSHFHFIDSVVRREDHALAWGILESFRAAAYFLGPLIAGQLLDLHLDGPFFGALGFLSAAALGLLFFLKANRARTVRHQAFTKRRSLWKEFQIWSLFLHRVWPLFIFLLALGFVDATFWSVGTLLSEELREAHVAGGFLLSAYTLPSLFIGLVTAPAAHLLGKKRAALTAALIAGLILTAVGFTHSVWLTLALVLGFALFFALTFPEIYATFEDYVSRLKSFGNDMVGLEGSAVSLAYIVGPVLAGAAAGVAGNRGAFSLAGITLAAVSVLGLVLIPRKIKMPQEALETLDESTS